MLTFPILHNECLKLNPGYLAAMPGMTKDEYENLKADIKEYGIANPILVDAKTMEVIDGHHRLKIAEELEMTCPFTFILDKDDNEETNPAILKWLAVSLNINRRHLGTRERQEIVMLADEAGLTVKEVAKTLGVHPDTVAQDRKALGLVNPNRQEAGKANKEAALLGNPSKPSDPQFLVAELAALDAPVGDNTPSPYEVEGPLAEEAATPKPLNALEQAIEDQNYVPPPRWITAEQRRQVEGGLIMFSKSKLLPHPLDLVTSLSPSELTTMREKALFTYVYLQKVLELIDKVTNHDE